MRHVPRQVLLPPSTSALTDFILCSCMARALGFFAQAFHLTYLLMISSVSHLPRTF